MAAFFERVFAESQAHAADLRGALEIALHVSVQVRQGVAHLLKFSPDDFLSQLRAALARTPAQSLGRLKAGALRELESLVTKSHDSGEVVFWSNIEAEADRLEKECCDVQA